MRNIFLAPRSSETSYENFESTIMGGRPYSFLEPYLNDSEKNILSQHKQISVWGNKESLKGRWEKIQPGDYILFYAKGVFYYSARVMLIKYSRELGEKLWPLDEDGEPWPCLFFVDNLREVNIPIKTVQELAEYEPTWDRVQGFMKLRDEGLKAITEKFGSIETFLNQSPEVYQYIDNILEKVKEETVEGEKDEVIDKESILKEAEAYKDSGVSHVLDSSPRKLRVENAQQKKRIAKLENYACQICNWSLEWINSKGKKAFRIDVDHIVDKAKGGGEEISNLWALCPNCHVKKTLGVIVINPKTHSIVNEGKEIKMHHDNHLNW
ncbi:MAG: endonuclease [Patescibacteria group bacterium]|nr:endonuclease [Patescibacteria group bacterium]